MGQNVNYVSNKLRNGNIFWAVLHFVPR
jgi:hypothetical protein